MDAGSAVDIYRAITGWEQNIGQVNRLAVLDGQLGWTGNVGLYWTGCWTGKLDCTGPMNGLLDRYGGSVGAYKWASGQV